eukprot:Skav209612  [mRNA]  locus=scaffold1634:520257:520847:+ [translate_table: standard]
MPLPTTKSGWIDLLRSVGESVPTSWNIAQLHAHWIELQKTNKEMEMITLDDKMKQLRKASRKKDHLISFLKDEDIEVTGNMTIAQMMGVAEKQITQRFPPTGAEHLGFGKHGHLTYAEVMEKHPGYVAWGIATLQESDDPGWRLERFVKWASHQPVGGMKKTTKTIPGASAESSTTDFSLIEPDMSQENAEIEQMK